MRTRFNVDARRPYQDFGSITGYASDGMSSYNAFQVRLNRRFTSHFLLNAHYVWSKTMDNASGAPPQIYTYADRDATPWARANADSRNQFVLYGVWELPQVKYNKFLDKVASGWQVTGIVRMASGIPYNFRNDFDSTLRGITPGSPDLIAPFRKLDPRQVQTFTLPNGRTVPAISSLTRLYSKLYSLRVLMRLGSGTSVETCLPGLESIMSILACSRRLCCGIVTVSTSA